jgi:hypothetical protein
VETSPEICRAAGGQLVVAARVSAGKPERVALFQADSLLSVRIHCSRDSEKEEKIRQQAVGLGKGKLD